MPHDPFVAFVRQAFVGANLIAVQSKWLHVVTCFCKKEKKKGKENWQTKPSIEWRIDDRTRKWVKSKAKKGGHIRDSTCRIRAGKLEFMNLCLVDRRNKMPGAFRGLDGCDASQLYLFLNFSSGSKQRRTSAIFIRPIPRICYKIFMSPSMQTWQQQRTQFCKLHISMSTEQLWQVTLSPSFHWIFQFFMSNVRVCFLPSNEKCVNAWQILRECCEYLK